jgi:hypothetical protein
MSFELRVNNKYINNVKLVFLSEYKPTNTKEVRRYKL